MSDDEADPELLELLRQSLGINSTGSGEVSSDTGVLKDAQYIYNNATDISVDMYGTKAAAAGIYQAMQEREYSTETWSQFELHPKASEGFSDVDMVNFIFTMDLLNFSFWSSLPESERFQIEYRGRRWSGYNSLLAALRRALDEQIPITTPRFWRNGNATDREIRHVFRSATREEMPLLDQRVAALRQAAEVLRQSFSDLDGDVDEADSSMEPEQTAARGASQETTAIIDGLLAGVNADDSRSVSMHSTTESPDEAASVAMPEPLATGISAEHTDRQNAALNGETVAGAADDRSQAHQPTGRVLPSRPDHSVIRLVEKADKSAGKLVNLLAKHFACFDDQTRFDGKKVRLLKRAQILAADLWAAFNGTSYGEFYDIDTLTMFADYRLPQMLHSLGVLSYSPALQYTIIDLKEIASGHGWEVQLRGCSIWAVEMIRREILADHPGANVNSVLIDFFLYDLTKAREQMQEALALPHHRTRSIWY